MKPSRVITLLAAIAALLPSAAYSQANLPSGTFVSIPPCRLVDTRLTAQGAFGPGETRTFNVVGSANLSSQGGSATGCNIPGFFQDLNGVTRPGVAAVALNYIAAMPQAGGFVKAWPSDQPTPPSSTVNFQKLTPNLNIANGTVTGVRQDVQGGDISILASQPTHVVIDAVGYYSLPGQQNAAPGFAAGVLGGSLNNVTGDYSGIGAGLYNQVDGPLSFGVGTASFIAASHDGTFMYADDIVDGEGFSIPFSSASAREFAARATGGFRFVTAVETDFNQPNYGEPTAGCNLPAGSGAFACTSDRNAKTDFVPLDPKHVLKRLVDIPIQTWRYKGEPDRVRHMGATSQDFSEAFGVGADDKHISTIDADGVAFAAIQGLYAMLKEKDREIAALRRAQENEIERLRAAYDRKSTTLEARLSSLERMVATQSASGTTAPALGSRSAGREIFTPTSTRGHALRGAP